MANPMKGWRGIPKDTMLYMLEPFRPKWGRKGSGRHPIVMFKQTKDARWWMKRRRK